MQAARFDPFSEGGDAVRIARAGAENGFARTLAKRRQHLALDDLLHLLGVKHREHDSVGMLRERASIGAYFSTELRECGVFGRVQIEAASLVAAADETPRKGLSQQAKSDDANATRKHFQSGGAATERGTASRLSRNGFGMGTPRFSRPP